MTGQELQVSWSGRHAIVTMPDEIDLGNSGDVDEQLKAVAGAGPGPHHGRPDRHRLL